MPGGPGLLLSKRADRLRHAAGLFGHGVLLLVTSSSIFAVLFIFFFIAKDALPFFRVEGIAQFFGQVAWYPTETPPYFGAAAIFYGTAMVTVGSIIVAVPLGISASLCLSDILPFALRQMVKPVIELLAAIPSVAFGFVAMVVLAPMLQEQGGRVLAAAAWIIGAPLGLISVVILSDLTSHLAPARFRTIARVVSGVVFAAVVFGGLAMLGGVLSRIQIVTGVNALNASVILGIMALPTIVSVSEDALQAVGRELREGSYALGATRAETLVKVVIPAAASGICAAVILGVMRAVGETMVVLMAAGGASHIPEPCYNFLASVRTLTATIVAEMGEADQTTGATHYHALFALALSLLVISFVLNMLSEWVVHRAQKKLHGK